MSEEYNPQALLMENIERLEVEVKEVIRKRDKATDPREKELLQRELDDLRAELKYRQNRLA